MGLAVLKVAGITLITIREAEKRYGVSHDTLSRAVKKGLLKAIRVGKYCLLEPKEVARWKRKYYHPDYAERTRKRWERAKLAPSEPTKPEKKPKGVVESP